MYFIFTLENSVCCNSVLQAGVCCNLLGLTALNAIGDFFKLAASDRDPAEKIESVFNS